MHTAQALLMVPKRVGRRSASLGDVGRVCVVYQHERHSAAGARHRVTIPRVQFGVLVCM